MTRLTESGQQSKKKKSLLRTQVMELHRFEMAEKRKADCGVLPSQRGVRQDNVPDGMPFVRVCIHTDPFSS